MSFLGGNLARIATDGETLYVAANPGVLYALDADDGTERWRAELTGVPMKGGNVALANGVVYYIDEPAAQGLGRRHRRAAVDVGAHAGRQHRQRHRRRRPPRRRQPLRHASPPTACRPVGTT